MTVTSILGLQHHEVAANSATSPTVDKILSSNGSVTVTSLGLSPIMRV